MTEASLKIDSFGRNIQYTGHEATIRQLYHLILMKPETDPLNPGKGCNARSYYYQIKDDAIISQLETTIRDQIATYTPHKVINVSCKAIKNKSGKYILHIIVMLPNSRSVIVSTDGETSSLNLINA